jgi:light-regulated signal transduction histidine kinase (bacteriophytochrome)
MISKVFFNLIDNAFKYNRSDHPTVHISHQLTEQAHEFSVTDNGIGIQDIYSDDIFKMFKKLHVHHEFTGSGVGLALSRKIIELHQGRIWLEKKEAAGSLFKFTIPRSMGGKNE